MTERHRFRCLPLCLLASLIAACAGPAPPDSAPLDQEPPTDGRTPAHRSLARLLDGRRPFQPRLVGFERWSPCRPGSGGAFGIEESCGETPRLSGPGRAALRRTLARVRDDLGGEGSPAALHAAAIAGLLLGASPDAPGETSADALAAAAERLDDAARRAPGNASIASDLAAVRLLRFRQRQSGLDLVGALAAAGDAVAADPRRPEARFNRALALEAAGLYGEAATAWGAFQATEPERSEWAAEAWRHRWRLSRLRLPPAWEGARPELLAEARAGDLEAVRGIVAAFPEEARRLALDELLAGGEADDRLAAATLGQALAERTGNRMVLDAARAAAESGDGLVELARGRAHLLRFEIDAARKALARAERSLAAAGSPLAGWAALYLAICDYQGYAYDDAVRRSRRLRAAYPAASYPRLAARALRLEGLSAAVQGRPAESLAPYRAARDLLERAGELEAAAGVEQLLAGSYRLLGDLDAAGRHLVRALRQAPRPRDLYRHLILLEEAALAALALDAPRAALAFQSEEIAVLERSARGDGGREADGSADRGAGPVPLAQALRGRAATYVRLGDADLARADLDRAAEVAATIPDPDTRRAVAADIALVRGEAAGSAPAAVAALREALDLFEATGYGLQLADTRTLLARALLAEGDEAGARAELEAALDGFERARANIAPEDLRGRFFDRSRAAFDLAASLDPDPAGGLETAERARARLLYDRLASRSRRSAPRPPGFDAAALAARLPADWALVEYLSLDDELLAWTIRRGAVALDRLPAGRHRLESEVERLRTALLAGDRGAEAGKRAHALYRTLLEPLEPRLAGVRRLILVPDRALHALPPAVLRPTAGGPPLADRFELAVAPSAALVLDALSRPAALPHGDPPDGGSALVVGAPAHDRTLFALPELPGALEEARRVAALHPGATLLTGADATPARFAALAPRAATLHFAGHAIANLEAPLLSTLLLAPDPATGASGALYGRDLLALDLGRVRLAVLSACGTATGRAAEAEGVHDLARLVLAAGAEAVVATLWEVDDAAAAELQAAFHRELAAGAGPAAALRTAQLEAHRAGVPERDWAPFILVGTPPAAQDSKPRNPPTASVQ